MSLRFIAFTSIGLGALIAGCSGGVMTSAPSMPSTTVQAPMGARGPQAPAPDAMGKALYVSDNIGKSVFRFVINGNGTLQPPAGSSLVLPYNPFAIAIAGGELYVTNQVNNSVEVYKAGSTGSTKSKRSLLLNFEPTSVAVDANGYEFVGGSTNGYVAVFAPKAKGHASPIQEISLPDGHATINGVAVDAAGNLYVTDTNEVSEFTTPTTNPTLYRAIIGSGQQNGPSGISIDPTEEAYVSNTGASNVLAYSPTANGTSAPDRIISATGSAPLKGPIGNAVRKNDLYVTSGNQFTGPPSVFVFDKNKGAQKPLQIVTGTYLALPVGAAIGP
jgi:sugar lactone lactonase YvrE